MPATSAAHEIALQPGIPFLAEYVIERMLDRGEDWALYMARHATRTTERFRIRVARSETALHPEGVDLQLARAARLARLDHPGIVPYVTSGLDPDRGLVAVVSRHLLGITLRERFERGGKKLTRAEISRIVCELGDALDCLHDLHPPIVHGRLDASRVLLAAPDAGVRLIGLEESVESGDRPARDQFALASIAYECLTGRAPFGASATVASDPMPRLDRFETPVGTSADLDWVLHRAWSTDESRRFASAGRLAAEIARLLGEPGAVDAARVRRTERANARTAQSGSGTQRAVRPPTLPTMPAVARPGVPEKRPSGANLTAPTHAPSGERPAILPNAGRYAIHNERTPRPRTTTATVTAIPMPKPVPTLPLPASAGVSARTPSTLRTPTLVGAPAIPSGPAALVPAPVAEVPAAPVVRTPTFVGPPRAPSAPAALVSAPVTPVAAATPAVAPIAIDPEPSFECDVEVLEAVSAVASGSHRAVDPSAAPAVSTPPNVAPAPVVHAPIAAVAPVPPAPIAASPESVPSIPVVSQSEPPPAASAFMNAILDARATAPASSEPVIEFDPFPSIPPRALPIPLVANPRPREATPSQLRQAERKASATPAPRPRGRRFIHLVGAIGLALLFGGAEKLAPHVPAARRWVAQWINPPHAITPMHVPAFVPAEAMPSAPVPQPPIVATPAVAVPSASDRAHATAAWRAVVEECATRVERDRRHARFTVTYEGTTGAAVDVSFGDPFFRTHAIGACIADGARNVHVEPFTDRQWTGNYSILVP